MARGTPQSSSGRSFREKNPNFLLDALPADVYARVQRELTTVPVVLRQLLHEADAIVERVYFPAAGFCSLVTLLADGRMVEVATIGREGAVGALAALEDVTTPTATMVQGKMDACLAMPADAFRREMDRRGPFHGSLTRHAHALISIAMQSTACNAVHSIEQRLAR